MKTTWIQKNKSKTKKKLLSVEPVSNHFHFELHSLYILHTIQMEITPNSVHF